MEIIFCRGMYLVENSAQTASVEFVRYQRINYARSGLQSLAEKPVRDFSTVSKGEANRLSFCLSADIFLEERGFL